jgi:hypothetical protein
VGGYSTTVASSRVAVGVFVHLRGVVIHSARVPHKAQVRTMAVEYMSPNTSSAAVLMSDLRVCILPPHFGHLNGDSISLRKFLFRFSGMSLFLPISGLFVRSRP